MLKLESHTIGILNTVKYERNYDKIKEMTINGIIKVLKNPSKDAISYEPCDYKENNNETRR